MKTILNFEYQGTLAKLNKIEGNGVYLFVFNNTKIIYVGTSFRKNNKGLNQRINENLKLFKCGGRTFRLPISDDIYDTFKIEEKEELDYERKMLLWIPSNSKINNFYLSKFNTQFSLEWQALMKEFINKVSVYAVKFKFEEKIIGIKIESLLQAEITNYFILGEYKTNNGRLSGKIGKQSFKRNELNDIKLIINGLHEIDNDTKEFLEKNFA